MAAQTHTHQVLSHRCTQVMLHRLRIDTSIQSLHTLTHAWGSVLPHLCVRLVFEVICQSQRCCHGHLSGVPACLARPFPVHAPAEAVTHRWTGIAHQNTRHAQRHRDANIHTECLLDCISLIRCQMLISIQLNVTLILPI